MPITDSVLMVGQAGTGWTTIARTLGQPIQRPAQPGRDDCAVPRRARAITAHLGEVGEPTCRRLSKKPTKIRMVQVRTLKSASARVLRLHLTALATFR